MSKHGQVNALFNTHECRFRKRQLHRHKRKVDFTDLTKQIETLLHNYKSYNFCLILGV